MTNPVQSPKIAPRGTTAEIEQGAAFQPKFDAEGLIPAIIQHHASGEILMFAWMNQEALEKTLETGVAHFWTRSRKRIWRKGEESGNTLQVRSLKVDCDQDVLLLSVDIAGNGVACHTGARSCFYREMSVPLPATASAAAATLHRTAPDDRGE